MAITEKPRTLVFLLAFRPDRAYTARPARRSGCGRGYRASTGAIGRLKSRQTCGFGHRPQVQDMSVTIKARTMKNRFSLQRMVSREPSAICATLALVLAAGLADVRAEVIQQWGSLYGLYSGAALAPFDPSNGQLTEVELSFDLTCYANYDVYNSTPFDVWCSFSLSGSSGASVPGTSLMAVGGWSGGGGGSVPANSYIGFQTGGSCSGSGTTSLADDLNFFTGTDPIQIGSWTSFGCVGNPQGNCSFNDPSGQVELSYVYTVYPVPEPTTLTLLVGGLALLGLLFKPKPANPTDDPS